MGYALQAILARCATLAPAPSWIADSRVVFLQHDVAMIPLTNALYDQLSHEAAALEDEPVSHFAARCQVLATLLEGLSQRGVVAYVEAEYFGGVGDQWAIVWRDSKVVLGPLHTNNAINQALHLLNVEPTGIADAFDTVGLGQQRTNEDWLKMQRHRTSSL